MLEALTNVVIVVVQPMVVVVVQVNIIIVMDEQLDTNVVGEEIDIVVVVEETNTVIVDFGEEIEVILIEMIDYNMIIDQDFKHTFAFSMLNDLDFESNQKIIVLGAMSY